MDSRGFVFAETLVSSAIMLVLIITFYIFSTTFIDNQNKYKKYDNLEDIYKIANIRLFLYRSSSDLNDLIDQTSDKGCVSLNNVSYNVTELTNEYNTIKNEVGATQLYICNYTTSYAFDDDFDDYYEYTKKYEDKYRLLGYFNNDKFASIKIWRVANE